jgi:ADP-dependent NAD(P)H-hydrate dehydratase / NAD(P)H-hydrate epimerase
VIVIGGAAGLTGAPTMSALAAQRAGAGYVTVATPKSAQLAFSVRLLEAMTRALPEDDGALGADALEPTLELAERASAVVLGPGLGRAPATQELARTLVRTIPAPLVLDADGLNAVAGRLQDVATREAAAILTPHAGELGRLLELDADEVDAHRLEHARQAAAQAGAIVVLKGDDTLVAEPDGRAAVSPGGAPALATAGTGDVLAGVLGAFLGRGLPAPHAAHAGVLAHRDAGRIAADSHGPDSVIASDVIAALPAALSS